LIFNVILWVNLKLALMENPFELLDQRLSIIEDKLDRLIERIDVQKDTSVLDPTWVTTKQLSQHLGISTAAVTNISILFISSDIVKKFLVKTCFE